MILRGDDERAVSRAGAHSPTLNFADRDPDLPAGHSSSWVDPAGQYGICGQLAAEQLPPRLQVTGSSRAGELQAAPGGHVRAGPSMIARPSPHHVPGWHHASERMVRGEEGVKVAEAVCDCDRVCVCERVRACEDVMDGVELHEAGWPHGQTRGPNS